eukprot:1142174-Pelagomonas_calceolata.AAC.1
MQDQATQVAPAQQRAGFEAHAAQQRYSVIRRQQLVAFKRPSCICATEQFGQIAELCPFPKAAQARQEGPSGSTQCQP